MRFAVALFAFTFLCGAARAQIIKISLNDPKKAKSLKAFCIEQGDELFLVGEVKSGLRYDETSTSFSKHPDKNEIWVADQDSPRTCPYRIDKGEKVKVGSKSSVSLKGDDIKGIGFFLADQSLYGLSKEYARREDEIDDLKKQRDASKRGTAEWKTKQTAIIQTMERLRSWLDQTMYAKAAKKVEKDIESEVRAAKDASAQRFELAKASIKLVPVPEDLVAAGKEIYGEAVVFHQMESLHCRIIYREEIGDEQVRGLLELAENLIEGFRVQFVDPYVADDFKDYIPDEMFTETYFGPDDVKQNFDFLKKYYGYTIQGQTPEITEKRKNAAGHEIRRSRAPNYVYMWRAEQIDFEGAIAHNMGHALVNIHFNQHRANDVADWLYEGVGNWLSLEYLGRNSVQCINFDVGKYARKERGSETDETNLLTGTADIYHRLALEEGPTIDSLAIKRLADFGDPDVAKAFSVFNYVAKTQGEKGQRWLRACCNAAGVSSTFAAKWRKASEEIFEITGMDVFKKIADEWKAYAEEQIGGPISNQ